MRGWGAQVQLSALGLQWPLLPQQGLRPSCPCSAQDANPHLSYRRRSRRQNLDPSLPCPGCPWLTAQPPEQPTPWHSPLPLPLLVPPVTPHPQPSSGVPPEPSLDGTQQPLPCWPRAGGRQWEMTEGRPQQVQKPDLEQPALLPHRQLPSHVESWGGIQRGAGQALGMPGDELKGWNLLVNDPPLSSLSTGYCLPQPRAEGSWATVTTASWDSASSSTQQKSIPPKHPGGMGTQAGSTSACSALRGA